ncbi:helix-turn-helix domain-containing protein [Desertivirga xinjiangensis]|uniref:helix-turn-helix domain-containing protein n=1 Tax=Desertivirga xinjiangensis TaxID=539206 RepID=UPI002108F7EC|nr:helix-turn-helix domain-containing protein [Pedobacter xinjiangensis]
MSRVIIGSNIKSIRNALGLSQHDFSIVTDVSKRSIANIEAAQSGYNLDLLDKILSFLDLKLKQISDDIFTVPDDFRDKILNLHKKRGSPAVEILSKRPKIVFGINHILLKKDFMRSPLEVHEIKDTLKKYGWDYKSSSISNALNRMPDLIEVKEHGEKKNTFVYSRKK